MSIELEIKMKVNDHLHTLEQLKKLYGKHIEDLFELNCFYDREDNPLREAGCGLRVRYEKIAAGGDRWRVTYKGQELPGRAKIRPEYEIEVDDGETAGEIFTQLGFKKMLVFEKRRSRWQFNDCVIELDEVPYLGCYVEIEGETEELVLATRELLNLSQHPLVDKGYANMLAKYAKNNKIDLTAICFPNTS